MEPDLSDKSTATTAAERLSPVLATGGPMYGLGVGDEEMREYHASVWEKSLRHISTLTDVADYSHRSNRERLANGYPGLSKYQGTRYFVDVENLDIETTELRDNGMPQSIRYSRLKKLKQLQVLEITIPLSEAPLIIGKIRKLRGLKRVVINLCCTKRDYVNNFHRTVINISFHYLMKLRDLEHLSITANDGRYNNIKIWNLHSLRKLKKLKELDISAVSKVGVIHSFLCSSPYPIGMKKIAICYDIADILLTAAWMYKRDTQERIHKFEDLFDVKSEEDWASLAEIIDSVSEEKKGFMFYMCLKQGLEIFAKDMMSILDRDTDCEKVTIFLDSSIFGTNKEFDPVMNFQHDIDLVMKNYQSFVAKWLCSKIKSMGLFSTKIGQLKVYRSFIPSNERTKKQTGEVLFSIDEGIWSPCETS